MVLGLQTFYTVNTCKDICSIITILSLSICMITLQHTRIYLAAATYDTRTHSNDLYYQIWMKAGVLKYYKAQAVSSKLTWIINNYINILLVADFMAITLIVTSMPWIYMTTYRVWCYWKYIIIIIDTCRIGNVIRGGGSSDGAKIVHISRCWMIDLHISSR